MTESHVPTVMEVGAVRTITVCARDPLNPTGIQVVTSQVFTLRATGKWTDRTIVTEPDGYEISSVRSALSRAVLTFFKPFLRLRNERYFCLIGSIGRNRESRFAIGKGKSLWKADADGELLCFANDVPGAYGNNHGSISLDVKRTS